MESSGQWRFTPTVVAMGIVWLLTLTGFVWWTAKLDAQVGANTAWILQNSNIDARLAGIDAKLELLLDDRRYAAPYDGGAADRRP